MGDAAVADASTALNQGSLISVCIKPDADGIADGIKMRSVDSFEWTRDAITQAAVESGVAAGNLLTSYDETACNGGDYCQFQTILFAAFYATEGQVSGNGVASMQFGTRRLSEVDFVHSKRKMLQRPPNLISLLILKLQMMVLLHSKLLQVHLWELCFVLSLHLLVSLLS